MEVDCLWIHHAVITKEGPTIQNQLPINDCPVIVNAFSYIWKKIFAGTWFRVFFALLS